MQCRVVVHNILRYTKTNHPEKREKEKRLVNYYLGVLIFYKKGHNTKESSKLKIKISISKLHFLYTPKKIQTFSIKKKGTYNLFPLPTSNHRDGEKSS